MLYMDQSISKEARHKYFFPASWNNHSKHITKLTWYKINLTRPKRGIYDKQAYNHIHIDTKYLQLTDTKYLQTPHAYDLIADTSCRFYLADIGSVTPLSLEPLHNGHRDDRTEHGGTKN
jgi:hypothetical protein